MGKSTRESLTSLGGFPTASFPTSRGLPINPVIWVDHAREVAARSFFQSPLQPPRQRQPPRNEVFNIYGSNNLREFIANTKGFIRPDKGTGYKGFWPWQRQRLPKPADNHQPDTKIGSDFQGYLSDSPSTCCWRLQSGCWLDLGE